MSSKPKPTGDIKESFYDKANNNFKRNVRTWHSIIVVSKLSEQRNGHS